MDQESSLSGGLDFKLLFEAVPGVHAVYLANDPVFTVAAATDDYLRAGLVKREDLIGRGVFEVFPDNPDNATANSIKNLSASLRQVVATGLPDRMPLQRYDIPRPASEGGGFEERYWSILNRPHTRADGSVDYIVHSAEDVTDQILQGKREQRAALELRVSELRFRQLAEASTAGIIIGELDGKLTYFNPAMQAMLGYTGDELVSAHFDKRSLTPPEYAHLDGRAIEELASTGRCAPYEKVYVAKDGRRVPALVMPHMLDPLAEPKEIAAFVVELTERKRSERDAFLVQMQQNIRRLTDPDRIVSVAAQLLGEHLRVDRCVYGRMDPEHLTMHVTSGFIRGDMPGMFGSFTLSEFGMEAARSMQANLPFTVNDVENDGRVADAFAFHSGLGTRALIAVPVFKDGLPIATMGVQQSTARVWRQEEIDLVQIVANRCWESQERAIAVRDLQKSEERLRLAQAAARIGTFEWIMGENRIVWTPELEALYGLQEGAFEGNIESWTKRVLPEDAERVLKGIVDCTARSGNEYVYEFRLIEPSVAGRWLRGHANFFYDDQGSPVRMVGLNIDIDAQKRGEIELRQQWNTFDNALSNTPDFIYILDRAGRFTYANQALLKLWQRDLADAIGKNFYELNYPAELAARLHRQAEEVIQTGETVRDQTPFTGPDGETRHYEYIFSPALSPDGAIQGVAGTTRDITEQTRVREFIQEDRQRWRDLLFAAPAAVALLQGPEHRLEWVNTSYMELVDRTEAELIGKTITEALPEVDDQVYVDLLNGVYRRGESFVGHQMMFHVKRKRGVFEERYVNFVYAPTRGGDGEITGIFAHITDVTDEVASRRRAEDSERQFRTLVDSARDHAIVGLDSEGRVTSWNTGAERLLGYGEQEITGRPADMIFTPEDISRGAPEQELRGAESAGHATNERWHVRKDGSRFWGSGTITRVLNSDGDMTGFVKVFQDRTAERVAEEQLLRSEERFRQLADSMPQMVWTSEPDGKLDYYNRRWYDFTGFDPSVPSNQMPDRVLHDEDKAPCYAAWDASVASGEPYHIEYRLWDRREMRWRWFLGRALAARDASGKVVKWFGTCTDIDDQKTTQQAVLQAQKLESIGLLAGGIAHDFNNLLVGIMGGASFAIETLDAAHPAYELLQGVVDASERAAHLTRQMLAYAGKGRFIIEPVDLSAMAKQTAELVSASIPKSVRVEFQLDDALPAVHTDPGQMQQVAMNLIINAAEAVGEDAPGLVVVRTLAEEIASGNERRDVSGNWIPQGYYAVLEVRDTGSGIEPEALTRIFDPFFTTKFTGRGLGLAAVMGIVRSHKGAIEVETQVGKGSTFRVLLPARPGSVDTKAATASHHPASSGSETILVIDDEAIVRNFAKASLLRAGYTPVIVEAGEQGLDYIRAHREIALVLLDMSMPGMSGRQVLEQLESIRPALPVVICSGYSQDEVYRQFSGLKMAGVLQKPFTTSTLVEKVRTVLDAAVKN